MGWISTIRTWWQGRKPKPKPEPKVVKTFRYMNLEGFQHRRQDKKMETYWKKIEEDQGYLTSFQKFQQEWNFCETDYNNTPSNNGLDFANPAFAFTTDVAKFLKAKEMEVYDDGSKKVYYRDGNTRRLDYATSEIYLHNTNDR